MTESQAKDTKKHEQDHENERCLWCRRQLPTQAPVGRKRSYCKQSCRQRAYEARRQADLLGLSEHELIITKAELERLQDLAYVLQGVVVDVDRAMAHHPNAKELQGIVESLLTAAHPLVDGPLI